jgi:hypothetical protein
MNQSLQNKWLQTQNKIQPKKELNWNEVLE